MKAFEIITKPNSSVRILIDASGCSECPFSQPDDDDDLNAADPDEGYYRCNLMNKTVWGESPSCTSDHWVVRMREELTENEFKSQVLGTFTNEEPQIMTIEDIESFGFRRLEDEYEPVSKRNRAVFSKLINTNTTPHHIRLHQAGYNETDWHVKKEGVQFVNVATPEQLADAIWVLSGFSCRTFA